MKFKYLTKAEFDALSEYGKEKYTDEKREAEKHEVEEAAEKKAKEIAEGIVETVKTELTVTIDAQAEEIKGLKLGLSESEKKTEKALADMNRISLNAKSAEVKTMQNEIYEALSNPESEAHKQMVAYRKTKAPINFEISGKETRKVAGVIPYVTGTSASQWVAPVGVPHETVQARDIIPVFNTENNSISYVQFTKGQGKIASVLPGGVKPLFDYVSTPKVTPVVKIAGHVDVQEEFLDDVVGAPEWLAQELPWAYKDEETRQTFFGLGTNVVAGAAPELNGLYSEVATAVIYSGSVTTASNNWDKIAMALTNTRRALRPGDAIWMSPEDYMELLINKSTGATQIYDYPIQANTSGNLFIGGIPIYFHTVFAEGQGIAGNFQRGVSFFQKMGITLRTSTENGTNFVQNIVTFLIEARVAMPVYFPESFKKIDLTFST